jgi:signal transduction histidine kinase
MLPPPPAGADTSCDLPTERPDSHSDEPKSGPDERPDAGETRPVRMRTPDSHRKGTRSEEAPCRPGTDPALLDALPLQIALLDVRGRVLSVNEAARCFARENEGTPAAFPGVDYLAACRDGPADLQVAAAGIRAVIAGECLRFTHDYACHGPARKVWLRMTVSPLPGGRGIVVSHSDITEHVAEAETRTQLFRQEISAREQERQRIAAELHGGICQTLTAILLGLQLVQTSTNWDDAREHLGEVRRLSAIALAGLRKLIRGLRPTVLDDLGLTAALQQCALEINQTSSTDVEVCSETGNRRLPAEMETGLFRIAREALDNVLRHAAARSARIDVRVGGGSAEMTVSDDGVGFDPVDSRARSGVPSGIDRMRERARLAGGTLTLRSRPGEGTAVSVRLPLPE